MRITVEELLELEKWEEYCDLHGLNVWAVKEGQIDHDEDLGITIEEARKIGIIKED